ncbi:CARDB domain-containing protein [Enterocloster sp.]|uniref:COG1361 S-layer family protein n=1 Tax=Enterocloster sp. TaxID=2719315 RepID=UPI00174DF312
MAARAAAALVTAAALLGSAPLTAAASDFKLGYNTYASDNDYIFTTKAPKGNVGKSMSISFRIRAADSDMENVKVSLLETTDFQQIEEKWDADYTVDYYPFEIMETTFVAKSVGNISKGSVKSVSLSARVRRDAAQGYYSIPIQLEWGDGESDVDYVNIWISTSPSSSDDEEDKKEGNYFVIGENQSTPRGIYPNVLDFSVNFRNKRETTAQDVTISMGLSEDDTKFPFEINDGNYDRTFERVSSGETVSASYSMAIRKNSYTGYYPIKYTITFRLSSEGDLHTEEGTFYVHIVSKDKDDDLGEFNANDRTRARLIVDSFHTIPEEVYAGSDFELVLNMKNASTSVPASNILFNLESEKVSDSAVFTTETGTSSLVVDALNPGQTTEVRAKFTAKAGVDQRSYAITIKEKYDSPEFKNAEENITVDIPVKQYAKLSTSNIEVMPDNMSVGSESNVMFGINNTGKVVLYNVSVSFAADSIKPVDAYVGNIKPGETGNVDTMLTGIAPTADDGTIKLTITYEDENGIAAEPVEKELTLMVTEETPMDDELPMDTEMDGADMEAEPAVFDRYKLWIVGGAAVLVIAAAAVIRIRKKRRAAKEEDIDDEIS